MKNYKKIIYAAMLFFVAVSVIGCSTQIDNVDYPTSIVSGQFLYKGQPVQILATASDATSSNPLQLHQLGKWDEGYIKVFAKQDGAYTINTYDGDYYLVVTPGRGPWVPVTDTIRFTLKSEHKDANFNVTPYYWVSNINNTYKDSVLTTSFNLEQVVPTAVLEKVVIYLGTTTIVDVTAKTYEKAFTTLQPGANTISLDLKTLGATDKFNLKKTGFMFARVGVKTRGVTDLLYTPVVQLKN